MLIFTWDSKKNKTNKSKHKVTFEDAESCFFDPMHILINDPDHSQDEERMVLLGMSSKSRLLIVVHAEIVEDEIRIISARKADKKERKSYEEV
jgi:uncharacterized DUF497 family protein